MFYCLGFCDRHFPRLNNPMNTTLYIWVGNELCYILEYSVVQNCEIHYVRRLVLFNSRIFPGCGSPVFY